MSTRNYEELSEMISIIKIACNYQTREEHMRSSQTTISKSYNSKNANLIANLLLIRIDTNTLFYVIYFNLEASLSIEPRHRIILLILLSIINQTRN